MSITNRGPIIPDTLCQLLAEYEETHAVEDYWAFGWQVWPVLRNILSNDIWMATQTHDWCADRASPNSKKVGNGHLTRRLEFYCHPLQDYVRWAWDVKMGAALSPSRSCDVLIFGSGARYQFLGGKCVHYATGPFADLLEGAGLRCHTWQWEEQPTPFARASANVAPALRGWQRLAGALGHFRSSSPIPGWYPEIESFYCEQLAQPVSWGGLAGELLAIAQTSRVLERWLRSARPGLVVLDCWSNWPLIAAALAAHRLSIPVMELQHGIQEHSHVAYHWWRKEPAGGWPARPDLFWVWGARAENLYYETNRTQQEVIRGGNPWIRRWLLKTDPEVETACKEVSNLVDGYSRSILVTLQNPGSLDLGCLKDIISTSPSNWIWLIRAHPAWKLDRLGFEQEIRGSSRAVVRLHEPDELPLYALLRVVDLHVSSYSTCSNEALAFGKPTILLSEQGLAMFREFVEKGIMYYVQRPSDFYGVAEHAFAVDPVPLKCAGQSLFVVDERDTICAVSRIVEVVESQRQREAPGSISRKSPTT